MYSLSDYMYTLPVELIAQGAIHPQHDARLMVIDRSSGALVDESTFWHLDRYIPTDRVMFFNDSRVLPARIRLENAHIEKTDGSIGTISNGEILFCQKQGNERFEALVRPGKKFQPGTKIFFEHDIWLEIEGMTDSGRLLRAHGTSIESIMREYGELPLPPYIEYSKEKEDDYQTVFAREDGSVAAPTASLHFTKELLEKLPHEKAYTTLHVGLGTFQGIDTEDIRDYHIHEELVEVSLEIFQIIADYKNTGKKLLAVGTTACRSLESLPYVWKGIPIEERHLFTTETQSYWDALTKNLEPKDYIHLPRVNHTRSTMHFSTSIYIYPGKDFLLVDDLITNFHLPESSLLVLVSAFISQEAVGSLYQKAVERRYRFFSFGDGMYIRGK